MTPERQNEIWAMLAQEEKTKYSKEYLAPTEDDWDKGYEAALCSIFGTHNLTAQAEEKPNEPRFKVGDCVKVTTNTNIYPRDSICLVMEVCKDQFGYKYCLDRSKLVWLNEAVLEPYTEPKEMLLNPPKSVGLDYAQYRLALAKEIAVAMVHVFNQAYQDIPEDAVTIANEIVKLLKKTEI